MEVPHVYVPMRNKDRNKRGLSEQEIKKRLERQGWIVWRGEHIGITRRNTELYPNVQKKYDLLLALLSEEHSDHIETLQYMAHVHHGLPDFLCCRRKEWKFVECKFLYEQLSLRQKICIEKLQVMGFAIEVHKLIDHRTKLRNADVNVHTQEKRVKEKQMKLPRRTKPRKVIQ